MASYHKVIAQKTTEGIIRSIFGAIPTVGTALNEAIFEIRGRIKQQRLNSFINEFAKFLNENQEDINIENIKNEDFIDLFESVIIRVVRTQSEIKRQRFKDILINKINISDYNIDNAEIHLSLISELSEKAIEILTYHAVFNKEYSDLKERLSELPNLIGIKNIEIAQETNRELQQTLLDNKRKLEREFTEETEYIDSLEQYRTPAFYNITDNEFLYYKQSLASKALLVDVGVGSIGCRSFDIMNITQFGQDFINFIVR